MTGNAIFVVCTSILVQTISGQCVSACNGCGEGYPYGPIGFGWGFDGLGEHGGWRHAAGPIDNFGGCGGFGGFGPGFGYDIGPGIAPSSGLASSFGGGFTVTSTSPVAPTGLVVTSENAIEGSLAVFGQLPFLGSVSTDGAFPSTGTGAISYSCGDGSVSIVTEGAPVSVRVAEGTGCNCGCNDVY